MNKYRRRFAFLLPLTLAAGGCVNDPDAPATSSVTIGAAPYVRGDISTLTYRAVDLMLAAAPEVGTGTPSLSRPFPTPSRSTPVPHSETSSPT